jgi:glycosyltransferase involved in cell wall biosynthesis
VIFAFDITSVFGLKTGVGVYAWNLIRYLRSLSDHDAFKLYSCRRFFRKSPTLNPFEGDPNTQFYPPFKVHPALLHLSWHYLRFPNLESIIGDVDLAHGLSYVLPRSRRAKKVLTVYDLTFMLVPQTHPFSRQKFLPDFVKRSVRDADAIIAISESTKRDILSAFSVSEHKITVTHLGVDHSTFNPHSPLEAIESVKRKFSITKDYIFYLGTIEPRKNVDLLLEAFQLVKESTNTDFQLVLSGKVGWKVESLMKVIRALVNSGDVIHTGYISEQEAACLYNGASVFVYPSQYEGFGIPAVEAMACGCPVIASNSSSLPEVVGDAGVLVEPNNVEALSEAIFKILHDGDLRRVLKEKGVERAAQFTWERTAKATRDLYGSLFKG